MKKIYLLFVSLLFISNVFSQNISVLDMDKNNLADDTIHVNAMPDDSLQLHLMLVNNYTKSISVLARKYEKVIQSGSENTFCLGTCYPPTTYVATNPIEIAAGDTNQTAFYLDFYPKGTTGENIIGMTFYDEVNEEDSVHVVFKITVEDSSNPTSVYHKEVNDKVSVFPNPVTDNLNIYLEKSLFYQVERIRIFNVSGKLVYEKTIEISEQLNIPVNELEKGFYILKLTGRKIEKTQKFLKQ